MRRLPRIWVSFVLRSSLERLMRLYDLFDLVDVLENRDCVFLLEQPGKLRAAGMARRDDADEGHAGGGGGARIVDGVAHVPELAARLHTLDGVQPIGSGLGVGDVFCADHWVESDMGSEAGQRDV